MNAPLTLPTEQQESACRSRLGERVRAWRTDNGMTRKALSSASGVSERYLAQLESGRGNISVLLLRKIAMAMGVAVGSPGRGEEPAPPAARIALIGFGRPGQTKPGAQRAPPPGRPLAGLEQEEGE